MKTLYKLINVGEGLLNITKENLSKIEIPNKTSDILVNDANYATENYVDSNSELTVQDKDGITQFTSSEVRFEGAKFDSPTSKIIIPETYITLNSIYETFNFNQGLSGWCVSSANNPSTAYTATNEEDPLLILTGNNVNDGSGAEQPFAQFYAPFDMYLVGVDCTSNRDSLWDLNGGSGDTFEFFVGSVNKAHNFTTKYFSKSNPQVLYRDTISDVSSAMSYDNHDHNITGTNFKKDGSNNLLLIPQGHAIMYSYRSAHDDTRSNPLRMLTQLTFKKA